MSETAHTKGPWIFYADLPNTDPNWHIITTENKFRIVANIHIEPGNAMDEANARLIASAPELFDALKAFIAAEQGVGNPELSIKAYDRICEAALKKALAAVAKAEGRT